MNPLKAPVPVSINGEELDLRYDWQDFASAEIALQIPLISAGSSQFWNCPAAAWRLQILLYVGLAHCKPGLTLDEVRSWINWENHLYLDQRVSEAMRVYMRQVTREEDEAPEVTPGEAAEPDPFDWQTFGRIFGHSASSISGSQMRSFGPLLPVSGKPS